MAAGKTFDDPPRPVVGLAPEDVVVEVKPALKGELESVDPVRPLLLLLLSPLLLRIDWSLGPEAVLEPFVALTPLAGETAALLPASKVPMLDPRLLELGLAVFLPPDEVAGRWPPSNDCWRGPPALLNGPVVVVNPLLPALDVGLLDADWLLSLGPDKLVAPVPVD